MSPPDMLFLDQDNSEQIKNWQSSVSLGSQVKQANPLELVSDSVKEDSLHVCL